MTISPPRSRPTSGALCRVCNSLDLQALFGFEHADVDLPGTPHLLLAEVVVNRSSCNFCRLVYTAICPTTALQGGKEDQVPEEVREAPEHLRCYLRRHLSGLVVAKGRPIFAAGPMAETAKRTFRVEVTVRDERASPGEGLAECLRADVENAVGYIQTVSHSPHDGRIVEPLVDPKRIRSWVNDCRDKHTKKGECERDSSGDHYALQPKPRNLRVIDLKMQCVIPAKEGCRYIALSYISGGDQKHQLLREDVTTWGAGKMPAFTSLPATVQDAITVTLFLGERYLWVDSLCVVQDSPELRLEQIAQADLIFGHALFTIAAAAGCSYQAGLPGIRPGTRTPHQLLLRAQSLLLSVPLPLLSDALDASHYATRGWTYTERLLSPRTLFFTPYQIHYLCRRDTWSEDVAAEHHSRRLGKPYTITYPNSPLPQLPYTRSEASIAHTYTSIIADYTTKRFTSPADSILAIIGIQAHLHRLDDAALFVAGLPVIDICGYLAWQPHGKPTREPAHPSWSWAGWTGAPIHLHAPSTRRDLVAGFTVLCPSITTDPSPLRAHLPDPDSPRNHPFFRIPATSLARAFALVFNAVITPPGLYITGEAIPCCLWEDTPGLVKMGVFSADGVRVGVVLMPSEELGEEGKRPVRLLALSRMRDVEGVFKHLAEGGFELVSCLVVKECRGGWEREGAGLVHGCAVAGVDAGEVRLV